MDTDDKFIEMDGVGDTFKPVKKKQRFGVIKNVRNHASGVVHLDPGAEDADDGIEFFQPIYEGELVVGVIHKCACGRTAELRFQYSDQ